MGWRKAQPPTLVFGAAEAVHEDARLRLHELLVLVGQELVSFEGLRKARPSIWFWSFTPPNFAPTL